MKPYSIDMRLIRISRPDPYGLLVLCVGLLALLEVFLRHVPERFEALFYLLPEGTTKRILFVIGLLMVYLSEQIARRKRNAWYVVVVLLSALVAFSLAHHFEIFQILSYIVVLILFIKERRQFVVRSDADSFRRGLKIAFFQLLGALLVVGAIFAILDHRQFGSHLSTSQTLRATTNALLSQPLPSHIRMTRYDRILIDTLRITGIVSATLFLVSLFRPLRLRGHSSSSLHAKASEILSRYGNSSEDFFKLFPEDKHYFFYGDSFVAYTVKGGAALVIDGASGRPEDIEYLRPAFVDYCRLNDWYISLVHCDGAEAEAWKPHGFDKLQIGSEAVINSAEFMEKTIRNKHFRYIFNKARKDDLTVEWWQPPLSDEQIQILHDISDAWIESDRQEYSFVMAPFTPGYLRGSHVACLSVAGEPVAYINIIPSYGTNKTASIDHMRSRPQISSVAMHFLLAKGVEETHRAGFTNFNLGFVPLAKLELDSAKSATLLMTVLRRLGGRYYSSSGLEQFKGKFEPDWSPRYLAYQGGIRQLPLSINALRLAVTYKPPKT